MRTLPKERLGVHFNGSRESEERLLFLGQSLSGNSAQSGTGLKGPAETLLWHAGRTARPLSVGVNEEGGASLELGGNQDVGG